jgi:mono/diheme cytochrome c family protein
VTGRRALRALLCLLAAPVLAQRPAPWLAPAGERERSNPVAVSDDALKRGRLLFGRHCAMCHGERGRGDGPAARLHAQRAGRAPQDLTDPKVQSGMSDGEIFWKLSTGLKDDGRIIMPGFGEEIAKEEDRWRLVHYVRLFGKGN